MTISELKMSFEASLEVLRNEKLSPEATAARELLLPDGLSPVVDLVQEDGRRKRGSAAAWNWNPQSDRIIISFRPITGGGGTPPISSDPSAAPGTPPNSPDQTFAPVIPAHPPLAQQHLASTLPPQEEAVTDPIGSQEIVECCQALAVAERSNRQFIALKWFRDDYLATVDFAWAKSPQRRHRVLSHAIDLGRIDAKKIPNPKSAFPTTTISLNRLIPTPGVAPRFQPVPVRGEPVSATLLRDRGSI